MQITESPTTEPLVTSVMELRAKVGDDRDRLDAFSIAALVEAAERDFEWAAHIGARAELYLRELTTYADAIKPHRPNWRTAKDDLAKELREIERLRLQEEPPAAPEPSETVSVSEAARRLDMLKPSGKPTDRFYSHVLPQIGRKVGSRWLIHRDALDTYLGGGTP